MLVPFALLALAVSPQQPPIENPCAKPYTENVWDPRFAPGQQWSYRNRPIDQGSTFVVTKIDEVPGIGIVIQIDVLDVDLIDEPGTARPLNQSWRVSIAIRRDSLDASALQMLRIVPTGGANQYQAWQKNCGGLTYATTLADSMQAEQEAYLARLDTSVLSLGAVQIATGHHITFKLSLTANRRQRQSVPGILGHVTSKDGTPIKDANVELEAQDIRDVHVQSPPAPRTFPPLQTATDGSFILPFLDPSFMYSLKVTIIGFQSMHCIVQIFKDGRVQLSSKR